MIFLWPHECTHIYFRAPWSRKFSPNLLSIMTDVLPQELPNSNLIRPYDESKEQILSREYNCRVTYITRDERKKKRILHLRMENIDKASPAPIKACVHKTFHQFILFQFWFKATLCKHFPFSYNFSRHRAESVILLLVHGHAVITCQVP